MPLLYQFILRKLDDAQFNCFELVYSIQAVTSFSFSAPVEPSRVWRCTCNLYLFCITVYVVVEWLVGFWHLQTWENYIHGIGTKSMW